MLRIVVRINAMAISATASFNTPGVLVTLIPLRFVFKKFIPSTPTPNAAIIFIECKS